jgi:hypothetical protein
LYASNKASDAQEEAGEAAQDAAYANAADLLDLANINADAILTTANINAQAILNVGEYNAQVIENATARNIELYGFQAEEEVRRHVRAERMLAGDIRVREAATGWSINVGTPADYLVAQVAEGERQRDYLIEKHQMTLLNMAEEGADQAELHRLVAAEQANATVANAQVAADVALAEAQYNATAMQRSGDVAAASGQAAADATMWSGVAGAVSGTANLYAATYSPSPLTTPNTGTVDLGSAYNPFDPYSGSYTPGFGSTALPGMPSMGFVPAM